MSYNPYSVRGAAYNVNLTPPVDSQFAWVNQGTATVSATNDGIALVQPGAGASSSAALRVKTAPATPYTVTAYLQHGIVMGKQYPKTGLVFRESGTGKFVSFHLSQGFMWLTKWTSATAVSGDYSNFAVAQTINWFRVRDDGTNLIFSVSGDGVTFIQIETRGRTDFLAGGPNQVGFFVEAFNSGTPNFDAVATLRSWAQT